MNSRLRHLSFRRLATTEVHLRYLEDDSELQRLLGTRPKNPADLLKHAPLNARRFVDPADLAGSLEAYAERHEAPQAVRDNIAAIASGEAQVVVTGQQPGLFGGPLYSVIKAATTIRLARELSAEPGAPRVVPVFWNHSDDHDLDEVNRAFFVNPNMDVQRMRLELEGAGEPIRQIGVGRQLEHAFAAIDDFLPRSEFREWAMSLFQPQHPDEHFGDSMARLLFGMFGDDGLIVIEPRDLPRSAFDVLPKFRQQADSIRNAVRSVIDHLTDVGLDVTLDPSSSLMFRVAPGRRRQPLADAETCEDPTELSPSVLLRPLWQDAVLPTVGFVVGPGELSYLAVVGSLYKLLGVPRPAFVPRASLTLMEPSMVKHLNRFGWDIPELAAGPEELARRLDDDGDDGAEQALAAAIEALKESLVHVGTQLRESDRQMMGPLERSRTKTVDELEKLRQKIRNSRQNRQGTGLRQIRRLCSTLRPRGRMQERVLGVLPFLVTHGQGLADSLIEASDPFAVQHGIVEL